MNSVTENGQEPVQTLGLPPNPDNHLFCGLDGVWYTPNPDNHLCWGKWCGWYTPGGADFAGYLHNPYGYSYLLEYMKDAVDFAKQSNEGNTTIQERLYDILTSTFGNKKENETKGLSYMYKRLMSVIDDKVELNQTCKEFIGMIIWGADSSHPEVEITKYTTYKGDTINLTVQSICYHFIKEYIKEKNLEELLLY